MLPLPLRRLTRLHGEYLGERHRAVRLVVAVLGVLRLIQGLGGAAGLVLSRAVVRDLYDNTALARAFAVVALISNITPAVAPVAGGVLLHVMSWRGLFLVLTGAGAVLVAGTALFLPESLPSGYRQTGSLRATGRLVRSLAADRLFVRAVSALVLTPRVFLAYAFRRGLFPRWSSLSR